jgi:hypothetical protein
MARLHPHVVDDQVRAGTDERADAAERGCVGERDEELSRGDARSPREVLHHRDAHRHQRRVVDERRDGRDRNHEPHLRSDEARGSSEEHRSDPLDEPCLDHALRHDKQQRDGEDRDTGEPSERILRVEHSGEHQQRDAACHGDVARNPPADEHRERDAHDADREDSGGVKRQRLGSRS